MAHVVVVLTPEKVPISFRVAQIGSRIWAHLLDIVVVYFGALLLSVIGVFSGSSIVSSFIMLLTYLWCFGYFFLLEGLWNGRTVGKFALGLRVRLADGRPITFQAALYRNLLRVADFLPSLYTIGVISMFLTEKSQRLGDLAANTMVTHEKLEARRSIPAPHRFGIHPFESQINHVRGMSSEEYVAIKRLCDRFPELTRDVQARMIEEIWEPFKLRYGIKSLPNVHDVYLMEAVVMHYGRIHGLL